MHFTEDEIREIRNRLPLEVPTVTDSLQSSDGSSALSAKQGNLLGGRLALVESTEAAMRNIQTIYPWNGPSGVYSMVSAPDDTVNNSTNVRVAYELKKRTDDLSTQVNYIQQIIDQLASGSGGGGGGGSTVSWGVELSNHTVPLIVNGVSKTICLDGYSSGGGGGTGGDAYIGRTKTQGSAAAQALTGITSMTLEGAAQRIYFGDTAHFIEWDATNSAFHFSHGLYSNGAVSAGGVGTGGGGGGGVSNLKELSDVYHNGTGVLRSDGTTNVQNGDNLIYDSTNNRWYAYPSSSTLAGLTDVNENLNPSVGQVLYYTGSTNKWDAKNLALSDISGMPTPGTTTGYLKYTYSGGVGTWSIAAGTSGGVNSVTWDTTGITTTGWTTIGRLVVDGSPTAILAPSGGSGGGKDNLYQLDDVDVNTTNPYEDDQFLCVGYNENLSKWEWYNRQIEVVDIIDFPDYDNDSVGKVLGVVRNGYYAVLDWVTPSGGTPASVGSLSISSSAQTVPSSSESFSGNITLHEVAKTGSYSDLIGTPNLSNYVTSTDLSTELQGYMDLTTNQIVATGLKTFVEGVGIGSSSNKLTYDSSNNRFVLNGNLYVTGNIIATGAVTAGE